MILKKIKIKDYKSIGDSIVIPIKHNLLSLFGINESGKSNILRAINLLNMKSKYNFKTDLKREKENEKREITATTIEFVFSFDEREKQELLELINPFVDDVFRSKKYDFNTLFKDQKMVVTLSKKVRREEVIVDIDTSNIKEPGKVVISSKNEKPEETDKKKKELEEVKVRFNEQKKKFFHAISSFVKESLPKVIFWEPKPEYLITKEINIASFSDKPNTSVPLKNIFNLAGIRTPEIKEKIDEALSDFSKRRTLNRRLTRAATAHIHHIWKDYDNVIIDVEIRDSEISVTVKDSEEDTNFFDMGSRSDGFKRFVSLLLTLSAEFRSEKLENSIILLDEPDASLHPSGERYLLNELINISKKNYVLLATHSIFMVDRDNIKRHVIVEKENEDTNIRFVDKSNFMNEEVIYNALHFSIFELIKPKNVLFEGETDRMVFQIVNDTLSRINSNQALPSSIGFCNATGVEKIPILLGFFSSNKLLKFFTIVDYDKPGLATIARIRENLTDFSDFSWTYKNFINLKRRRVRLEDLMPDDLIENTVNRIYQNNRTFSYHKQSKSIVDEILSYKRLNNILTDPNLKEFKKKLPSTVLRDIRDLSDEEFLERYSKLIGVIHKITAKIASMNSRPRRTT